LPIRATPAQLFHLLRRQVKLPYRRPLIVSPQEPAAPAGLHQCHWPELASGRFLPLLADPDPPQNLHTLLLCTGKIYYELAERRRLAS